MKNMLVFFVCLTAALSCNQIVEEVQTPPYTVYPNPFVNGFSLYIDVGILPAATDLNIKVTDGSATLHNLSTAATIGNLFFPMSNFDDGTYYIDVEIDGQIYSSTILKAK